MDDLLMRLAAWPSRRQIGERNMGILDEAERLKNLLTDQEKTRVRIALFGQPGAGKSSLINALVGKKVATVGVRTDTTTGKAMFEHEGLEFWDLPGYGTERFPAETFWERFEIPSFDLFLCVFEDKFHSADGPFYRRLLSGGRAVILVRQKQDALWQDGFSTAELEAEILQDARQQTGVQDIPVRFVSTKTGVGMAELEQAIRATLDAAKADRWARSAKAWSEGALQAKRKACERYVYIAAGLAAANALNPIPGLDVALDLGTLAGLLTTIRTSYGLDDAKLHAMAALAPVVKPLADKLLQFATKDGLLMLLKQVAKRETVKELAKYVPIVGQAIAAGVGFALTVGVGKQFLDTCHEAASEILKVELAQKR
jgi:GTP-binding protein EngB required for normal cell division/uncharacterized protein (DUF697 family)